MRTWPELCMRCDQVNAEDRAWCDGCRDQVNRRYQELELQVVEPRERMVDPGEAKLERVKVLLAMLGADDISEAEIAAVRAEWKA